MRRRRNGLAALGRGVAIAVLAIVATTSCGHVDQLPATGGPVRDAPSVPPIPPPPDVTVGPRPIEGAIWEVAGHPAAILDVRVVAGGRIAYLTNWADVGVLTASGDVASWPLFTTRGWMAAQLDALPDGPLLAAVTNAGIEVWDVETGWPMAVLDLPWGIAAVAPDGERIATPTAADGNSRILIWDLLRGGTPRAITVAGAVYGLAWSPDGTQLALAAEEFLVVDLELDEVVWRADLETGNRATLRWSPEAPLVAHLIGDTVTVFDLEAGTSSSTTLSQLITGIHWADPEHLTLATTTGEVLSLAHASGHTSTIGSLPPATLAFEPLDAARAAIGTRAGSAGIWNFVAGEAERLVSPAMDRGEALAMSPDELRIVTGGSSGLLRTWRVADGALLGERLMGERRIDELAWSPDGGAIAVGHTSRIDLLDASTLELLASAEGYYPGALAFDASGRLLVSAGQVLDGSTLEPISSTTTYGFAAAWGPGGTTIAVGTLEGDVDIYDASTHTRVASLATGLETVRRVAWSPDGQVIAAGDFEEIVAIDAGTGTRLYAITYVGPLSTLAFSADSTLLVTSGWAGLFGDGLMETVRFWDALSGAPRAGLGRTDTAGGVAVMRDGRHLALTTWGGKVAVVAVPEAGP